jgi:hypothetical protein
MSDMGWFPPYKSLNRSKKEIRLLILCPSSDANAEIKCCFLLVDLDSGITHEGKRTPFEALSYVWGSPDPPTSIFLESRKHQVTTNLFAALRRLRYTDESRILWIDALCINQNDVSERNHQVTLMSLIYKSATWVIMWLGEEEDDSDLAMDFIARFKANGDIALGTPVPGYPSKHDAIKDIQSMVGDDSFKREWAALESLFSRPYWSRLWILQETVLNKFSKLYCGSKSVVFQAAMILIAYSFRLHQSIHARDMVSNTPDFVFLANWLEKKTSRKEPVGLLEALTLGRQRLATWGVDHIFGVLGLVDEPNQYPMPVDYGQSLEKAFASVVTHLINENKNLDVLSACKDVDLHDLRSAQEKSLRPHATISATGFSFRAWPSWIPDWTHQHTPVSELHYLVLGEPEPLFYHAAGNTKPSVSYHRFLNLLTLKGIEFDKVAHVAPSDLTWINANWQWYKDLEDIPIPYGDKEVKESVYKLTCLLGRDGKGSEEDSPSRSIYDALWFKLHDSKLQYPSIIDVIIDATLGSFLEVRVEEEASSGTTKKETATERKLRIISYVKYESRFFVTGRGYLGRGPLNVEVGDHVCVLFGGKAPFVLRKDRTKLRYFLLGDCCKF